MPKSTSKLVNLSDLSKKGETAIPIIKLMMVANDLAIANESMTHHSNNQHSRDKDRDWGASLYFLRLQLSHLHEGINVVKEIQNSPKLLAVLRRCDAQTQESFRKLLEFLPGGSVHSRFKDLVVRVRNNITFHYDESGKVIAKSLKDLAKNSSKPWAKVTRGDHAFRWRFNVADRVIDNIICRDIWKIPHNVPLRDTANENAGFVFGAFSLFLDFAGEFLWQYSLEV